MSIPVDVAALQEQIDQFGPGAFLVTTATDGPPHIASVCVAFSPDGLAMGAGRSTRANAARHPAVSLVWPARNDGDYCLIVDGSAQPAVAESETLVVRPTAAVLHRLAAAPAGLPRCLPLDTQRS